MSLQRIAVRNLLRNKFRTALTVLGVAVAILAFVFLRTLTGAWTEQGENSAADRIATRHKVTFVMPLPKRYVEDITQVPGVSLTTWFNWFGGKDPKDENDFFANMATDPKTFFDVYPEVGITATEKEHWIANRRGAIIGDLIAKKKGWKVGDTVTLRGTIFPGDWQFQVEGVYQAKKSSIDRNSLFFHWDYLNESVPDRRKDQVGWIVSRIADPTRSGAITKAIDAKFDERDIQTVTMSERAMQLGFLGMLSAVIKAIDVVSIVILIIMMLILGNTIAMNSRERTNEYGVLRAIGFLPKHVAIAVVGEALALGALGGGAGLLIAYPIVERGLGRWLEENMGGMFPVFRISLGTAFAAFGCAALLAGTASLIPAYRAFKIDVVNALRRVG